MLQSWIEHGATKFYIYHQSMSREFEALLRIYENDPTIEVNRIPWDAISVPEEVSKFYDPSNFTVAPEVGCTMQ